MRETVLAEKYAKALIACAQEADIIDQLEVELVMFEGILTKQTSLQELLRSPLVPLKEKAGLLQTIFKSQWISSELKGFLLLLLEAGRFNLFSQIYQIYKDLIYSLRRRLKVIVESTFHLSANQKSVLKQKLARIYRRRIDLLERLNPALIGGARVYVGHTRFDSTLQRQLALLGTQMKGA